MTCYTRKNFLNREITIDYSREILALARFFQSVHQGLHFTTSICHNLSRFHRHLNSPLHISSIPPLGPFWSFFFKQSYRHYTKRGARMRRFAAGYPVKCVTPSLQSALIFYYYQCMPRRTIFCKSHSKYNIYEISLQTELNMKYLHCD